LSSFYKAELSKNQLDNNNWHNGSYQKLDAANAILRTAPNELKESDNKKRPLANSDSHAKRVI